MRDLLARLGDPASPDPACACDPGFESGALVVDATDCPGDGDLADSADCRATVIRALADRAADAVVTRTDWLERAYEADAAALLAAAGRFVERVAFYDADLADRATTAPIRAARDAVGRAGPASEIAAETGLAAIAERESSAADALAAFVGPPIAKARVGARSPADATLRDRRTAANGATVRIYDGPGPIATYHLDPVERDLDRPALETLARAHDLLAAGDVPGGERAPGRAVRRAADDADAPVATIAGVLEKHTRGYGVLADLFGDPAVSDVFATAPVGDNALRVVADGERMRTNVRLTETGAETLASRFRRASGRAFSRASPTLDATADTAAGSVRVAGVTDPASDGPAFAFRARDPTPWTLPALVANGTLPADAAAFLSLAVERAGAGLIAGPRGAGKTTMLGALLWELPARIRTVVIEDTPELPVAGLQREGRDVQSLRTSTDDGTGLDPTEALRAALRLGDGALVVGEVRGEEARVLYEAMRVGANGDAVLGTIHGSGGAGVRERVVSDLDVPASSFAATDFVVTLDAGDAPEGGRRAARIEEVVDGDRFEPLFERSGGSLDPAGRIERGESRFAARLARGDERYADVRAALADREALFAELAADDCTDPADVTAAYADRRRS
ncbi:ATPase, T2SS/T4P/T4SS family [Halorussus marinus]|uniref:ATPase, T2SS/T4P/T4SS family n=1 Tax=Halorussus marinus TaxID=2505976 RepID=UPI001092926C|nr:ATPase, T2SS/T4P/T4SS family [Halorussus marinus]